MTCNFHEQRRCIQKLDFHDLAWPIIRKEPLHFMLKQSGYRYRSEGKAGNKEEVLHANFGTVLRSIYVQKSAELTFHQSVTGSPQIWSIMNVRSQLSLVVGHTHHVQIHDQQWSRPTSFSSHWSGLSSHGREQQQLCSATGNFLRLGSS